MFGSTSGLSILCGILLASAAAAGPAPVLEGRAKPKCTHLKPLVNGGFETGDTTGYQVSVSGGASVGVDAIGEKSGFSLAINTNQGPDDPQAIAVVTQDFPVCANTTYNFGASFFQIRNGTTIGDTGNPHIDILVLDTSGGPGYHLLDFASAFPTYISNHNVNYKVAKWHDLSLKVKTKTADNWRVQIQIAGDPNTETTVRFDNLFFNKV